MEMSTLMATIGGAFILTGVVVVAPGVLRRLLTPEFEQASRHAAARRSGAPTV